MKLKIHIIIYLTLRYVTEFFTDGMHFRKKLLKERLPFYLFTCLCLYLIISHIDYLFYVEAYELATKSNWRVVPSLEGFNIFLRTWPSVRSAGMFYAFVIIIIYNIYFWISILIPSLYKFVKKNIMMISLMLIFYPVLEYQLFWSYYFAYLFLKSCWAAWPLYIIWLYNFHLLHFAEELEEELEQNTTENEFDNIKFEESVVGDDDDDNSKVSSTYDDEIFGERPEALMIRYDEHIRKWYPDLLKEVKEVIIPVDEEQYVTYNAEGEPQFKYLVDEQLYNIRLLLAEQPKDIRQFYVIKMRWLWALPWEHYIRYKKYKRKFFRILVYFPMIIKAFTFSGFKKPKVVGPYSIFVPKWTVETWCKDRLTYNNYFIWILLKIFHYIYNFFSIFRRIDNFKWSLFQMKYLSQLKKLKKKKSKNYAYFKPRKVK